MKKTVSVNISGQFFHIDEDAYEKLSRYLAAIRHSFSQQEGCDEILNDIEARISEMLKEKVSGGREVVSLSDVEQVISIMGQPEDYLEGAEPGTVPPPPVYQGDFKRRIFRNPDDKVLGGVCGGLGAYFDIDPLWLRLIWVFMFFIAGFGILLYIVLWIIIPEARTPSEKLAMRGEPINVDNISRAVKDEMDGVGERIKKSARDFGKKDGADRLRGAVHEFFELLGTLIGLLGKMIVKVFGVLFIALALIFVISLAVFIFTDKLTFSSAQHTFTEMSVDQALNYFLPAGMSHELVWITLALLLIAPILGLLIAGVKMLFNIRTRIPFLGSALGVIFITGIAFAVYIGIKTADDFSSQAVENKSEILNTTSDTLYLAMAGNAIPDDAELVFIDDDKSVAAIYNDSVFLSRIYVDVLRSPDSLFHVEQKFYSRGGNYKAASVKAKSIRSGFTQNDSLLTIPDGFLLSEQDQFRNQKVRYNIYVPEGKTIYLDRHSSHYLYDVKNLQDMYDRKMGDKYWTMTSAGLSCLACTGGKTAGDPSGEF